MKHIEVASKYLNRATDIGEDDLYTDVIYRTNQAFEGSIKEAYRVLSGEDPEKQSIYEIEEYLKGDDVLRPRVLTQFSRYRKEWRNPSTHDYTLDFDQDEAFLALMSVSAFAKVLVDQIAQKLAERSAAERQKPKKTTSTTPDLMTLVAEEAKQLLNTLAAENDLPQSESELIGTLSGFMDDGELAFTFEPLLRNSMRRADMVVARGKERVIVEVKSSRTANVLDRQYETLMSELLQEDSDAKGVLILWHPDASEYHHVDWPSQWGNSDRLRVVLFSRLEKKGVEEQQTLGDILGNALKAIEEDREV